MINTPASVAERLARRTDRSGGPSACWPWLGARNNRGYGQIRVDGRLRLAHVVALIEDEGDRSATEHALHSCDNPPCVNPFHLRWGTQRENIADMHERGRGNHPTGFANGKTTLSDDQVRAIRASTGTIRAAAAEYGVAHSTIHNIRNGRRRLAVPTQGEAL